jgi:hypothetical protein
MTSDIEWKLQTPLQIDPAGEDLVVLAETRQWLSELGKPHPDLGRRGPVCPFIQGTFTRETMWLAVCRPSNSTTAEIQRTVTPYRDLFLQLSPQSGEGALFKAIVLIFPELVQNAHVIDEIQQTLKPFFIGEGLMIGEFHAQNRSPGLHNPHFFPLRSPYPMLAIRYMVPSDLPFLTRASDPPVARAQFLRGYLQRLGTILPEKHLLGARQALATVEAEMASKDEQQGMRNER